MIEREYRVLGRNPSYTWHRDGQRPYDWSAPVLAKSAVEAVKKVCVRDPQLEKNAYRLVKVVASGEIVEVEPE